MLSFILYLLCFLNFSQKGGPRKVNRGEELEFIFLSFLYFILGHIVPASHLHPASRTPPPVGPGHCLVKTRAVEGTNILKPKTPVQGVYLKKQDITCLQLLQDLYNGIQVGYKNIIWLYIGIYMKKYHIWVVALLATSPTNSSKALIFIFGAEDNILFEPQLALLTQLVVTTFYTFCFNIIFYIWVVALLVATKIKNINIHVWRRGLYNTLF